MKRRIPILLAVSFLGCSTIVKVPIKVTRPAEMNMSAYKQIVIGEVKGNMGQAFQDGIKQPLIDSGKFKVLDRSQLKQVLGELTLSQSDLVHSSNRAKLGKLLSAAVIFTGNMEGKYTDDVAIQNKTCRTPQGKDSEGNTIWKEYPCKEYTRTGNAAAKGNIDMVSVETGEVIKSKKLSSINLKKTYATDGTPESIDGDKLLESCLIHDINDFIKAVLPWEERVLVSFYKDSSIPELEQGIRHMQLNELEQAGQIFFNATKAAETNPNVKASGIAKAYWNFAVSQQYLRRYDTAIEYMKKAYLVKPDPLYLKGQQEANKMREELQALKQQGVTP